MKLKSFLTLADYLRDEIDGIDYSQIIFPDKIRVSEKDLGEAGDREVRIFNIEIERPNEKVIVYLKVTTDESDEYRVNIGCWDFKSAASVVSWLSDWSNVQAF